MKVVYPIIITKDTDDYLVYIPDFDINTQGTDIADAISMARDAIGMSGCYIEDKGNTLPQSSSFTTISSNTDDIVTLVDIDFATYRKANDNRAVRKNCTIPNWLNIEAEKADINFSKVLQEALQEKLHV